MAVTVVLIVLSLPSVATPSTSGGLQHLAQVPISMGAGGRAAGSDLAFQGKLVVSGAYEGIGFYKRTKSAPYVKQISFFPCPGAQGDVSIWGDILIVSKEGTDEQGIPDAPCNRGDASAAGIRILDISDVRRPKQLAFIPLACGSHTHTVVPASKKLIVYSSALRTSDATNPDRSGAPCNRSGSAGISLIDVPLKHPARARHVSDYDAANGDGCHDVTVVPKRNLAVAACGFTDTQVLDINNPLKPRLLSRIVNPAIQFHHQAGVTWDGKYLAVSDEALAGGCGGSAPGSIWFYDISDPTAPVEAGRFQLPRVNPTTVVPLVNRCWAHNFNIVPMRDLDRYVLVGGFYKGGLTVVDFSDPAKPVELAHDAPAGSDFWTAYWYEGRIYSMDWMSRRGLGVYELFALRADKTRSFGGRLNPQLQLLGGGLQSG